MSEQPADLNRPGRVHATTLPVSAGAGDRPTRVRYGVIGLALGLAMVTYLDRACIATLAPEIMRDLSLSKEQMSWIYSAFALAYALFEVPTAWWADRQGTRRVLTRIVLWWSAFTIATAAAANFLVLLVTRFLFGAGEAGAWPCVARTFSRWVPSAQRGRVQGIFFSGAHLAGGLTPMVALALAAVVGWRGVFVVFGLLGVAWAAAWYRWFRDEPAEHPGVNAAECALIGAGREPVAPGHGSGAYWRRIFAHRNTLPLCLAYIPNSCAFYFCITWLPTYLKEKHGFSALSLGFFSGLPLLVAVAGDLTGGVAMDYVARRWGLRWGRAGVSAAGNLIAAACMLVAAFAAHPLVAIGAIALAVGATMATLAAAWGTCQDVGGQHVGVLSAAMNTAGQIGSFCAPPLVIWLLRATGDWNTPIFGIGLLFLFGAVCWLVIDPRDKIPT